jgi:hypothetical protein
MTKLSSLRLILAGSLFLSIFLAGCGGGGDSDTSSSDTYTCQCKDGTYSNSCGHQGACSGHGGIA